MLGIFLNSSVGFKKNTCSLFKNSSNLNTYKNDGGDHPTTYLAEFNIWWKEPKNLSLPYTLINILYKTL